MNVQVGLEIECVMLSIIMLSVTLMEETGLVNVSRGYHAFGHEEIRIDGKAQTIKHVS